MNNIRAPFWLLVTLWASLLLFSKFSSAQWQLPDLLTQQ